MLLVATLLAVVATSVYGQHQLTIRENGKLCSPWIVIDTNGEFSLTYRPNPECASQVGIEQNGMNVRLCCQALVTTTSSNDFPRECGKQKFVPSKARIVGGVHAYPNSWPWQIRLHADGGLCGGTLVDARHVITAAHCIQKPINLQNYEVFVGLHDINKPVHNEQRVPVEKIFVHEQYNANTQENDITVIRLARPIAISDTVNYICLPGPEVRNENETVWVAGWGTTSFQGSTSAALQQTSLHTMPGRCGQIYNNYSDQKQICAGAYGGGRDTCQGDSGGPLMYESNGQWYLNGVVSYGYQCAVDGFPGVYARVSFYLPWIRSKISSA